MKLPSKDDSKNTLNIDFLNKLCSVGKEGLTYDEICETFSINKRTAQRWIATVVRLFPNFLMVRRTKRNKYFSVDFSTNHAFSFDFTETDVETLESAVDFLSKVQNPAADKPRVGLQNILAKLQANIKTIEQKKSYQSNTEASVRSSELVRFRGPRFDIDSYTVEQLSNAIETRKVCNLFYKSTKEPGGKMYLVAPIGFLYGQSQYLVAKEVDPALIYSLSNDSNQIHIEENDLAKIRGDNGANIYRFFKVNGIISCNEFIKETYKRVYHRRRRGEDGELIPLTPEEAAPKPDLVTKKNIYFALGENETVGNISYYCFGVFRGQVYHIKWRFDEVVSKRLDNYLFVTPSERQKTSRDEKGRLTVEFDACGIAEMYWFLNSFGSHVEVLEPSNWSELVRENVILNDVLPV